MSAAKIKKKFISLKLALWRYKRACTLFLLYEAFVTYPILDSCHLSLQLAAEPLVIAAVVARGTNPYWTVMREQIKIYCEFHWNFIEISGKFCVDRVHTITATRNFLHAIWTLSYKVKGRRGWQKYRISLGHSRWHWNVWSRINAIVSAGGEFEANWRIFNISIFHLFLKLSIVFSL